MSSNLVYGRTLGEPSPLSYKQPMWGSGMRSQHTQWFTLSEKRWVSCGERVADLCKKL